MIEDSYGRRVNYVRLSITDRCDLRCGYCMKERMRFLPKSEILSVEEIDRLCGVLVSLGVKRLRLTGGEPLTRRDFLEILERASCYLAPHLESGLEELTLTTNGTQLKRYAARLYEAGVRRVNVSLDTRDSETFARLTRIGRLAPVLEGVEAAREAGLAVKINMVALKNVNEEEIPSMIRWAHGKGMALTLIEVMPMAETGWDRRAHYLPLIHVRERLEALWNLEPLSEKSAGPASYVRVKETGGKLGFIAPLTGNFCDSCNRIRISSSGRLYACLGGGEGANLREILRQNPRDNAPLKEAIAQTLQKKNRGHNFQISQNHISSVPRPMSLTGG